MQVRSLVGEDALEKETATHSSILAWESPWTEEPSGLQSAVHEATESQNMAEQLSTHTRTQGLAWEWGRDLLTGPRLS